MMSWPCGGQVLRGPVARPTSRRAPGETVLAERGSMGTEEEGAVACPVRRTCSLTPFSLDSELFSAILRLCNHVDFSFLYLHVYAAICFGRVGPKRICFLCSGGLKLQCVDGVLPRLHQR
jgi:hypothetical protein